MNILFLTTHFNTGGITSYILTLGEALVQSGHKVWVASSEGDCLSRLEAMGIKHLRVNIRTKSEIHPKVFLSYWPLKKLIQQERIDIIHAQTRVTQVLGFFLSRSTKVAMVTTCHGFFKPRWFRKMFPCWGSAVIAISKPVAIHLRNDFKVPASHVYEISNGINLNHFVMTTDSMRAQARQALGFGEVYLIGIIARLSDVKGIDTLIKSMPLVLKEIPAAQLLIAGQGPQEAYLKQLTYDLSLTANIHFINATNQTLRLLMALDVFVMPSLMEGLGLSVMEAQACGIPVIATNVGGLVDLIKDKQSGFLVPVNDPVALSQRIIDMFQNPVQSKKMAGQARVDIEKNNSSLKMLKETLKVYEQNSSR